MSDSQVFTKDFSSGDRDFVCQRCGSCCRWPGLVKLTEKDLEGLVGFLGMEPHEVTDIFMDFHESRRFLILKNKKKGECIFYGNGGCVVHDAKPQQCRDFPNKWNFPGWREVCKAVACGE